MTSAGIEGRRKWSHIRRVRLLISPRVEDTGNEDTSCAGTESEAMRVERRKGIRRVVKTRLVRRRRGGEQCMPRARRGRAERMYLVRR
jgi:hypothetical protein